MARNKPVTIHCGSFIIHTLPAIPLPFEVHAFAFKLSILLTWTLWTAYMVFQFYLAFKTSHPRLGHCQWQLWTALVSETLLDFPSAVLAFSVGLALFSVPNATPRSRYKLIGDTAPDVDVLVTCCGESVSVICNTAAAAATQDYPSGRLRVYVLDDGNNQELRFAIGSMNRSIAAKGSGCAPITYLSRKLEAGEDSHFKSGNLRFGIEASRNLRGESHHKNTKDGRGSEFFAALDADMIPDSAWLRRMVPHMLLNDSLGLACPPQSYYNTLQDPLGQQADFDIYFSVQEALNDRLGAAMCTGSGYVARRSAIEDIGGWPLAYCGEDFMCSAILSDRGWGIAFVREKLQSGLAPESLKAVVKQRMRWTDAGVEVLQRFGYYLPGFSNIASRMTWGQRAVNMLYGLRDFSPLGITLAMVALPLSVLLMPRQNFTNIGLGNEYGLFWLQRLYVAVWMTQKINNWVLYRHLDLAHVANCQSQEVWTAPYSAYRNLIALLPQRFSTPSFGVCGAMVAPLNERSSQHRQPLLIRLLSVDMVMFMCYICYALTPLLLRLLANALSKNRDRTEGPTLSTIMYFPLPGVAVRLLVLAAKVSTPVRYMIWPPDMPAWSELVDVDEHGVKRPKPLEREEGVAKSNQLWWLFVLGCEVALVWACIWSETV